MRFAWMAPAVVVKVMPLLDAPPTVTATLPAPVPVGTVTTIDVVPQLVIVVAVIPLKVTVPGVVPNPVPMIVTAVPTGPKDGLRALITAATTMLSGWVAVMLSASVTCTVKLLVPSTVGVPVIAPVLLFSDRPAGKLPALIDQVEGVVPPLAANVAEYDVPAVPGDNELVTTCGVAFIV